MTRIMILKPWTGKLIFRRKEAEINICTRKSSELSLSNFSCSLATGQIPLIGSKKATFLPLSSSFVLEYFNAIFSQNDRKEKIY